MILGDWRRDGAPTFKTVIPKTSPLCRLGISEIILLLRRYCENMVSSYLGSVGQKTIRSYLHRLVYIYESTDYPPSNGSH
jgi:hypothetical protein